MYPFLFVIFTYTVKSSSLSSLKRVKFLTFKLDASGGSIIFLGRVQSGGLEIYSDSELSFSIISSIVRVRLSIPVEKSST